ncbi:MAG: hypothetical protein ACRYFR_14310 [Janthinobacterium lividum]
MTNKEIPSHAAILDKHGLISMNVDDVLDFDLAKYKEKSIRSSASFYNVKHKRRYICRKVKLASKVVLRVKRDADAGSTGQ